MIGKAGSDKYVLIEFKLYPYIQSAFDVIDITELIDSTDQNSFCIQLPNVVKQRTISLGRCTGPFYITGDDDIVQYISQNGQSILPKGKEIFKFSNRLLLTKLSLRTSILI